MCPRKEGEGVKKPDKIEPVAAGCLPRRFADAIAPDKSRKFRR